MQLHMTEALWADVKRALDWDDTEDADDVEMVHRMVQQIAILEKELAGYSKLVEEKYRYIKG